MLQPYIFFSIATMLTNLIAFFIKQKVFGETQSTRCRRSRPF